MEFRREKRNPKFKHGEKLSLDEMGPKFLEPDLATIDGFIIHTVLFTQFSVSIYQQRMLTDRQLVVK